MERARVVHHVHGRIHGPLAALSALCALVTSSLHSCVAPPSTTRRFTELGQRVYSPPGKKKNGSRLEYSILGQQCDHSTQTPLGIVEKVCTQCPVAPCTRLPRPPPSTPTSASPLKAGPGQNPCLEQETTGAPSQPSTPPACSSAEVAHVRRAKHLSNGVNRGRQQDGGRLPEKNVYRNRDARGSYPAPDGRIGTCACGDWLEQRLDRASYFSSPTPFSVCLLPSREDAENKYLHRPLYLGNMTARTRQQVVVEVIFPDDRTNYVFFHEGLSVRDYV